ncbi:MAG: ParA family protein [Spirochaetota bacterium]
MPSLRQLGLGIVAIANRKGGVGKTASAISIASGLSRSGQSVLAIDGDPQSNMSLFFEDRGRGSGDLSKLLSAFAEGRSGKLEENIRKNVRRGLDLLPAGDADFRIHVKDSDLERAKQPFTEALSQARKHYDWIIIDTSPSNGQLERLLIGASEALIIPLEFQRFSVSGLEALVTEASVLSAETGRNLRVHALIFTKAESNLARVDSYREVFSTFRIPVFEVCRSEYVPRSLEKSRTIWESAPGSYAAKDYGRIIEKAFWE